MTNEARTKCGRNRRKRDFVRNKNLVRTLKSTSCDQGILSTSVMERHFVHKNEGVPFRDFNTCPEPIRKSIDLDDTCNHNESCDASIPDKTTPLSAQWISEELLLETRKLWSKAYKRVISIDEALEILMNVKQVAEVLVKMQKRNNSL